MKENVVNNENKEEDNYPLLRCREKSLGYNSYCNDPSSSAFRKLIRSDIKHMYFFGRKITEEELSHFRWR